MIGRITIFFAAAVFCGAAQAGMAYDCEIKSYSRTGWIPDRLLLFFDDDDGWAQAYDGYIKHYHGDPIDAYYTRKNPKTVQIDWTLKNMRASNDPTRITGNYRAILNHVTGKVTLRAWISGNDAVPRGAGKCKPMDG